MGPLDYGTFAFASVLAAATAAEGLPLLSSLMMSETVSISMLLAIIYSRWN